MMPESKKILIKYGGNAMTDESIKLSVLQEIIGLCKSGHKVILVHGGGPFINKILDTVQMESEFIGGHRKTSKNAMKYIEMALKGEVNSDLVTLLNKLGTSAVGLSGKDAGLVIARKREFHENGKDIDLGMVGDVYKINPSIVYELLDNEHIPVIACIAADEKGQTFNINADMMAGALAGKLKVDEYIVLTDIDGLRERVEDPDTLISKLSLDKVNKLMGTVIAGGMIPKIESCQKAIENGANRARIVNGTKPGILKRVISGNQSEGTIIEK